MKRTVRILVCLILVFSMAAAASTAFAAQIVGVSNPESRYVKARRYEQLFREKYENSSGGEAVIPAADEKEYPVGTLEEGILVVRVAENGSDETGNGTESAPFATIQNAVAKLRETDKEGLGGITIRISDGAYQLTEPVEITAEDSSATFPLTIEGTGDTLICGGVYLTSADFAPAAGDVMSLFPEEVRDRVVMLDLKPYGYTPEDIAQAKSAKNYLLKSVMLSANGNLQTLCRYPNDDWSLIPEGWMLDQYGNVTTVTDNDGDPEHEAKKYIIRYDTDLEAHVRTWSMADRVFIAARLNQLWCTDNTYVMEFDPDDTLMVLPYTGGYNPVGGGVFYWYNIPEEMDMAGEYYVSDDAVLYYLPGEDFSTSSFTLPVSSGLFNINADSVTVRYLRFDASAGNGIIAEGDDITVTGCEMSSVVGKYALSIHGDRANVTNNRIHDVCQTAVSVESGDIETLSKGDSLVYNNEIYNFGINDWPYTMGVTIDGVGVTVSHNEIRDSKTRGIYWDGSYMTIEYNDVHDVLTASDDIGAISCDGRAHVGNVIRYNYIHNIGCMGALTQIKESYPDYRYIGCAAVYGDFYGSYYECYGNVIQTVNGSGFYGGGRYIKIHDNLMIDCSRWYVSLSNYDFEDFYNSGIGGKTNLPSYVRNEIWSEANPDLAALVTDLSQVDSNDPRGFAMPVGVEIRNNWVHFNKFVRDFSNWGIAPYSISAATYTFSGDTIDVPEGTRTNNNVSNYNSRRDTLDLEEVFKMASGVIDLDYETFLTMGLVK